MKNRLFKILLLIVLLATHTDGWANGFSYVYIQGDKSTPFYVKFEDQMLPRYGKNYCIIPQLIPGAINIQVLFQQNSYPPQKFTIVVPDNGFRSFLLMQKNGVFSLYDIQQQFYLNPGNKAEDDKPVAANSGNVYVYTNTGVPGKPVIDSKSLPSLGEAQSSIAVQNNNAPRTASATIPTRKPKSVSPKFLPNVELSNEHQPQNVPQRRNNIADEPAFEEIAVEPGVVQPATPKADTIQSVASQLTISEQPLAAGKTNVSVVNSDCPAPVGDREFEDLQDKAKDRTEKTRLKFLLTKVTECYTANQAKTLTEMLNNDPERYTFLKKIYPRVTDQHNFAALENLLTTQEWKSYFKLILPK